MLIKHQALATTLTHKLYAMNILIGHDPYLLNDAALQVKKLGYARLKPMKRLLIATPHPTGLCSLKKQTVILFLPNKPC
ncbi:hypothetical protein Loa_01638 [Legionella oakridgensis ATCC 33761 = DSM 21215]|uniref:Uncharacterized protein n=1 Tax=Legionella oakridgensis ATCC 33761 = DSM 21215 TaxID=1268635 RepID=W0BBE6_9GAMM|nr:hypothetical protein Loa_01638 [Legionella oakridgensis ATCC 33761 = DSM 21215]